VQWPSPEQLDAAAAMARAGAGGAARGGHYALGCHHGCRVRRWGRQPARKGVDHGGVPGHRSAAAGRRPSDGVRWPQGGPTASSQRAPEFCKPHGWRLKMACHVSENGKCVASFGEGWQICRCSRKNVNRRGTLMANSYSL
jgi:hypothetical protein